MSSLYTYVEHSFGGIALVRPNGEQFLYLQPGDDANEFNRDIALIRGVWESSRVACMYQTPWNSEEEHIAEYIRLLDMNN